MTASTLKRIGIIAALPGELAPLVKGWTRIEATKNIHHWEHDAAPKNGDAVKWIAVCAGIGRDAATRAFAAAEKARPLTAVVSIGWAGALRSDVLAGSVVPVDSVLDAQTGEKFEFALARGAAGATGLVSCGRVADSDGKARLATAYPAAQVVDMEAAAVARLASMRGIPAYCFKGVSDGADDRLPDLNPFIDASGQFETARFVASVLVRPQYWSGLLAFGGNSRRAARVLAEVVRSFLEDAD